MFDMLLCTGAGTAHLAASHAAGADGHLAKPVTVDRLFAALAGLGDAGPRQPDQAMA